MTEEEQTLNSRMSELLQQFKSTKNMIAMPLHNLIKVKEGAMPN
ncbi:hypothetical protein P4H65_06310 [Paenibacillus chitinolyticus]|nr:hypothetical protein [Paenibacillus chitinolyticus]MEC0245410.1 hypothetical protein [Paenibacillus chitinolyticus]